jgi:hypothetical protein
MNYAKATDEEVEKYFESHPEHLEMMMDDREESGNLDLEREKLFDFTEFVVVPNVGVVPIYWENELDDIRAPDWSSEIYNAFVFKIYKFLWFVIADFTEDDERELKVFAATDFDEAVKEAERREQQNYQDFEDHYYGYNHQTFSNGKQFKEKLLMPDVDLTQLEEIESRSAPGFPEPEDLYASVCQSDEGDIYVKVNPLGGPALLMQVDSMDEARMIMSELWQ